MRKIEKQQMQCKHVHCTLAITRPCLEASCRTILELGACELEMLADGVKYIFPSNGIPSGGMVTWPRHKASSQEVVNKMWSKYCH